MQAPKLVAKNIPKELRVIDSWLLWRLKKGTKADGTETWLKVPHWANGNKRRGALGTKEDRDQLVSFDEAIKVYRSGHYAGVGFATMPEYPLTILDLDSCVGDDGELSDFAQTVVGTGTYVEYSPSGKGLRAVYTGEAICAGKRNGLLESGERVEIYCGSAFVTITGRVVGAECSKAVALPKKIKRLLEPVVRGGAQAVEAAREVDGDVLLSPDAAPVPELSIDHARIILNKLPETWGEPGHGTWYRVAAALHLQFDGSEEAYQVLDEWSQGLDGYDSENNRKRWDAGFAHDAGKSGITTMRNLVFESIQNGGLKVKASTMRKWGLARSVEEDFGDPDEDEKDLHVLPEYSELDRMFDIGRMLDTEAEPVDWLVENLIPRSAVSFLAGGSGTSKSFFIMQLSGMAAVGMDQFAGLKIKEGGFSTAILSYEETGQIIHGRVRDVAAYVGEHVDILGDGEYKELLRSNLMILPAEVLDSGDWQFAKRAKKFDEIITTGLVDYLRAYVETKGIDLLVFDTGSEIHSVEENSAPDMVVVMRALRQLASGSGVAVLVLQHVSKGVWNQRLDEINQGSIRGSSVLVDKSRNVFMLARMPRLDASRFGLPNTSATHEDYVVLKHLKANMGGYVPMQVFERTSRGLLVHRPDVVEGDPGLQDVETIGERENKRTAMFEEKLERTLDFIRKLTKEKDPPHGSRIGAWSQAQGIPLVVSQAIHMQLIERGLIDQVRVHGQNKMAKHWGAVDAAEKPGPDDILAPQTAPLINGHSKRQ